MDLSNVGADFDDLIFNKLGDPRSKDSRIFDEYCCLQSKKPRARRLGARFVASKKKKARVDKCYLEQNTTFVEKQETCSDRGSESVQTTVLEEEEEEECGESERENHRVQEQKAKQWKTKSKSGSLLCRRYAPRLSEKIEQAMQEQGLCAERSFDLSPGPGVCNCAGCLHLEPGDHGWARELAMCWKEKATNARAHKARATRAFEIITNTYLRGERDPSLAKPCEQSFAKAMVVRRLLEYKVTLEGGYRWQYADMLRVICIGLARHELATRMVQNKLLLPVEPKAIEATRDMFASLKGFVTDHQEKVTVGALLKKLSTFRLQVKSGHIDRLAWSELTRGCKKQFQRLGSKQHIVSVWALFLGRCPQPLNGIAENHFESITALYDALVAKHRKVQRDRKPPKCRKKIAGG